MTARTQPAWLAILVWVAALVLVPAACLAAGDVSAVLRSAHFAEPLVATGPTTAADDQALAEAVAAYERRSRPDDLEALTGFLSAHPESGWAPALLTNLGLSYLHDGYFTRALDAWQRAWTVGKAATEPHARALVDRAVGELARLYATLGKMDELAALFDEIGTRPITGSATEAVQTARETLALVHKEHRHLFNCGPTALKALMLAQGAKFEQVDFLQWYAAGPNGTSLAEVAGLADQAKFSYRLIFRQPGQPVPGTAIVHWKVGHYGAIVGQANGRYQVRDSVFPGQELWVTPTALDAEASGYFLVPAASPGGAGWRAVDKDEAGRVWGKGHSDGTPPGGGASDVSAKAPPKSPGSVQIIRGPGSGNSGKGTGSGGSGKGKGSEGGKGSSSDDSPGSGCGGGGMCGYDIKEATVSLTLSDVPVGYSPPIGPSVQIGISYNQREDSQPANFNFFNVSPKWTLSWLSYVTDDPSNPGATVSRYVSGGGAFYYTGYTVGTGRFAAQSTDGSILVLASQTPVTYQRQLSDGSVEIYAQSDGSTAYPRNIFLSRVIDPQGNAVTLTYDSQQRLVSLTDAAGRQTTFGYDRAAQPLLVTRITDPFGRSATLGYDVSGRLVSITDTIGITSSFTYDAYSLVNSLTTPYGTTTFAYTAPGTGGPPRFVDVTDPLGYHEREEWLEPAPIPDSDPSATVPQGMPIPLTNQYLTYRDSFHWDRNAYALAGCTPTGGCDYTKARDRHFTHVLNTSLKSTTIESVKYPLENRIWYSYPGQASSIYTGTYNQPTAAGRVLDDGTTQLSQYSYDTAGYFKLTQVIDPLGRTTSFAYANHVDLAAISRTTAYGNQITLAQFAYDTRHRPILATDAAGQTTRYAYNAQGQVTAVTNALGQTTGLQYDGLGRLTTVVNANGATAATFTYDGFDRVATYTDSEGWTVAYQYDAADRVTKITYPDGTNRTYAYDKLDLAPYQDRRGRLWTYTHDADRRLTQVTDPLGHRTQFGTNGLGERTSLTDANGNTTHWTYDVQGRLASKHYADGSAVTYSYENTTSRLKAVTDALGQTRQYGYANDNRLAGIAYLNAVNPTPTVAFADDPYFPRRLSMTDSTGTTRYSYVPVGTLGALGIQQESGPGGATIAYVYDALGRLSARTVAGAGAESFQYDALGRLTGHGNDLGQFTLSWLGQTEQITGRQLANSTLSTALSYLSNSGDRRLAGIANVGLSSGQYTAYAFTSTPENQITGITTTSDAAPAYPSPMQQSAAYNNLNQLTTLGTQVLTWDADGNLLADGQRSYTWDAANRLIGIGYPGQAGKQTSFAYDGLGRRIAITSTPAGGGGAVTTAYVWCDSEICQARTLAGTVQRSFYAEGEFVPGTPAQSLYYGVDHLGSVRRVFASTGTAPAYDFDPYGAPLQFLVPNTDYGYAGMLYNTDSGLYLTRHRAYDPSVGRWLSRDPIGEDSDPAANLYGYVGEDPIGYTDANGDVRSKPFRCSNCGAPHGGLYDQYCPECYQKSLDPNGGVPPPSPKPIEPTQCPK